MKLSILINYAVIIILLTGLSSCNFKANKEYKKAVESADASFSQKKYTDAKALYTKALEFKAEETYPKEKIAEIDKILVKMKEEAYLLQVKNADKLFEEKKYGEAKTNYEKASKMKSKEQYPIEMIQKIDKLLAEIKKQEEYLKYPYHIVVGCFKVPSNAVKLNKKLMDQGLNSRIIRMGNFDAVTYSSFPNLTASYNNLKPVQGEFNGEAWVYKH